RARRAAYGRHRVDVLMRRSLMMAALAIAVGGCSLIFDGNDLKGKAGGGDGGMMNGDGGCGGTGGNILLTAANPFPTSGVYTFGAIAGDFDKDGFADVATADFGSTSMSIL